MPEFEVQTRSEETGLVCYSSLKKALKAASEDGTIWKISFSLGEERVRLIRHLNHTENGPVTTWSYEPIDVDAMIKKIEDARANASEN